MKRAPIGAALLIGVAGVALAAQQPSPLGLRQAVEAALEVHPLLRSARLATEQAANRESEARADRFPKVRVSEDLVRSNNPVFVFGSLLEQGRFGANNFGLPSLNGPSALTNLRTTLSTSLPVFDGMKTSSRIAQSVTARKQALQGENGASQQIRLEVIQRYYGVLAARAALDVAEQARRMAEADLQRAKDRMDAGLAVQSDHLAAQVQVADFTQQTIQARGELATASALLNITRGADPGDQTILTAQLVAKEFEVPPADVLISRALTRRAEIRTAEAGIEAAGHQVTERRSEYFPELNVFASLGSSSRDLTSGSSDYTVRASATFNLFDRGRSARVAQGLVNQRAAETERDRIADQIRADVIRAYYQYRSARERVDVAESALAQAAEGLRIMRDRYEAGLSTISDVLRAETALVRTRTNVVTSRHDQYLAYAVLLFSNGELDDVSAFEP